MQIIRECRMRAAILTEPAKDAPELEVQLLYVAKKWLTLAGSQISYASLGGPPQLAAQGSEIFEAIARPLRAATDA
jgi:hypothetical protein